MSHGSKADIAQKGCINLKNGLILKYTLSVLTFNFKLLFVSKMVKDNGFVTVFPEYYIIYDFHSKIVKGIGKE